MKSETPVLKYTCPKCGGRQYSIKGIIVQFSQWKNVFSLPGSRFTAVICEKCKYTEHYNLPVSRIKEAFDFSSGRG